VVSSIVLVLVRWHDARIALMSVFYLFCFVLLFLSCYTLCMRQQRMTRRELLAKKHETALIWRIILFSFFSFALLALVFYYAIPIMVKIADLWETARSSHEAVIPDMSNAVPIPRPQFEVPDRFATNSAQFVLKGTAQAGLTVHVVFNGQKASSVVADSSGVFTVGDIMLRDGVNTFVAYAQDAYGRKSAETHPLEVTFDTIAPKLDVVSPLDDAVFRGFRANIITVSGKTDGATQMYVNGSWIILQRDGTFSQPYQLSPGENILTFYALDDAGNRSVEVTRKVTYFP